MSSTTIPGPLPASLPRKVLAWLPTLVWLGVLAMFSTDTFSAEHTGSILEKILHALFGTISPHVFREIHFLVRKSAHFCSYGLLSLLAFFSWRATLPARTRWSFRWATLALLLTLLAGSFDEFHQTFVPSRTPAVHDVLLDMAGAIFFQLVILMIMISRREPAAS